MTIGLTQEVYSIAEDGGQVRICASIVSGQIERTGPLLVTFTALSASTLDFDPTDKTLTFSQLNNVSCVDVGISDNDMFDDDKRFSVELQCNAIVQCGPTSTSEVVIVNDDGEFIVHALCPVARLLVMVSYSSLHVCQNIYYLMDKVYLGNKHKF